MAVATYLCVLTLTDLYQNPDYWNEGDSVVVGAHFQKLIDDKDKGIVAFAGRRAYETGHPDLEGIVVFHAENDEMAKKFIEEDPAVSHGIMKFVMHPFSIAVQK